MRLLCDELMMLPTAKGIATAPEASALCPRPDCQSSEIVKKMLVKAAK